MLVSAGIVYGKMALQKRCASLSEVYVAISDEDNAVDGQFYRLFVFSIRCNLDSI